MEEEFDLENEKKRLANLRRKASLKANEIYKDYLSSDDDISKHNILNDDKLYDLYNKALDVNEKNDYINKHILFGFENKLDFDKLHKLISFTDSEIKRLEKLLSDLENDNMSKLKLEEGGNSWIYNRENDSRQKFIQDQEYLKEKESLVRHINEEKDKLEKYKKVYSFKKIFDKYSDYASKCKKIIDMHEIIIKSYEDELKALNESDIGLEYFRTYKYNKNKPFLYKEYLETRAKLEKYIEDEKNSYANFLNDYNGCMIFLSIFTSKISRDDLVGVCLKSGRMLKDFDKIRSYFYSLDEDFIHNLYNIKFDDDSKDNNSKAEELSDVIELPGEDSLLLTTKDDEKEDIDENISKVEELPDVIELPGEERLLLTAKDDVKENIDENKTLSKKSADVSDAIKTAREIASRVEEIVNRKYGSRGELLDSLKVSLKNYYVKVLGYSEEDFDYLIELNLKPGSDEWNDAYLKLHQNDDNVIDTFDSSTELVPSNENDLDNSDNKEDLLTEDSFKKVIDENVLNNSDNKEDLLTEDSFKMVIDEKVDDANSDSLDRDSFSDAIDNQLNDTASLSMDDFDLSDYTLSDDDRIEEYNKNRILKIYSNLMDDIDESSLEYMSIGVCNVRLSDEYIEDVNRNQGFIIKSISSIVKLPIKVFNYFKRTFCMDSNIKIDYVLFEDRVSRLFNSNNDDFYELYNNILNIDEIPNCIKPIFDKVIETNEKRNKFRK